MSLKTWLNSELQYGKQLVRSAKVGGVTARDKALAPEPAGLAFVRFARCSIPWAAMGATVGILASCPAVKRNSARRITAFGALGGLIGLGANMALSTRYITQETVRGAIRNTNTVRDAHWLARNPIDYA